MKLQGKCKARRQLCYYLVYDTDNEGIIHLCFNNSGAGFGLVFMTSVNHNVNQVSR